MNRLWPSYFEFNKPAFVSVLVLLIRVAEMSVVIRSSKYENNRREHLIVRHCVLKLQFPRSRLYPKYASHQISNHLRKLLTILHPRGL